VATQWGDKTGLIAVRVRDLSMFIGLPLKGPYAVENHSEYSLRPDVVAVINEGTHRFLLPEMTASKDTEARSTDPASASTPKTSFAGAATTVCMLTTRHRATDNRILDNEAVSLAKAGYQISVIGRHPREEIVQPAIERRAAQAAFVAPSRSIALEKRATGRVRLVPLLDLEGSSCGPLRAVLAALHRAWAEKADVYHFHDPELIPVGLLLKLRGARVIYDRHESYEKRALSARWIPHLLRGVVSKAWSIAERLAVLCLDGVIGADPTMVSMFPARKSLVAGNFPPLDFLGASELRSTDRSEFRLLYIGGIAAEKGVFHIVKALEYVRNKQVQFHLIGDLDDAARRRLEGHPKVVCYGRVPWPETPTLLAAAHAGTLLLQPTPAYCSLSGESIVKLFEYMAQGLPVIYSDFPNLRPLMDRLGAGIPVDPTDPRKIAQVIDRLCDDPELCRRLGENGRRAVRERYNWENEERKLLAFYERLLGSRKRRSGS